MTPGQRLVPTLHIFIQRSVPQNLRPELATWKLPCLKASIRRLWSVAATSKARLWLMQFHGRQWSVQLNFTLGPTCKKKKMEKVKGKQERDRTSSRAETVWQKGRLSRQRCFTAPDQIIELNLQCYHCRLTFLWVCEITHEHLLLCNTMRHTRPIPWTEELCVKW